MTATAVCEPAEQLTAGRRRRDAERSLAHAQREAARRYRRNRPRSQQSANWRRSQARVGRLHARVARRRANDLHAFTRRVVDANPVIVIETLATKNLLANRHLARAISDQGWGELGRQLGYKAGWAGGHLLGAPRFFPSSKTCACCGRVKPKLDLAVRTHRCEHCGHVADRDVNAAAVLAAWGEHTLGKCPCVTQVRDPDPRGRSGTLFHACRGWVSADPASPPAAVLSGEAGTSRQPSAA